ncbi:hypothetical protein MJC1_00017 [Methylocystis sp. MJC1]|jgi:hypothetical protein|nr:hypothetical protein MJC1_00017 [Methylocystis sp. MJC1]
MLHTRPLRPLDLTFRGLAVFFTLSAAQPSVAASQRRVRGADRHVTMCAYESQTAVARRHGLTGQASDFLALRIYANPNMAREADDAFDTCVRKQK